MIKLNKKIYLAIPIALFFFTPCLSQGVALEHSPKFILYLEGYGNNLIGSITVEKPVKNTGNHKLLARFGLGGISSRFGVPIGLQYLSGKNGKYVDLGIGITYIYGGQKIISPQSEQRGSGLFFTPTIGYRRQVSSSPFFFRANAGINLKFMEFNQNLGKSALIPTIGLSFGYVFWD